MGHPTRKGTQEPLCASSYEAYEQAHEDSQSGRSTSASIKHIAAAGGGDRPAALRLNSARGAGPTMVRHQGCARAPATRSCRRALRAAKSVLPTLSCTRAANAVADSLAACCTASCVSAVCCAASSRPLPRLPKRRRRVACGFAEVRRVDGLFIAWWRPSTISFFSGEGRRVDGLHRLTPGRVKRRCSHNTYLEV